MSAFVTFVYATGVFASAREAKTSNADNSIADASNEKFTVAAAVALELVYPIIEAVMVAPAGTLAME